MPKYIKKRYEIDPVTGCWNWLLATGKGGYGVERYNGPQAHAHRNYYERKFGKVSSGLVVCHKCDNRLCVNPDHMFVGTQQDNINDKVKKGRQSKGEGHGMHKLGKLQVLEIREMRARGVKRKEVARHFGIHEAHVTKICHGRNWNHI